MIAKTIFPLITITILSLTITAVYADTYQGQALAGITRHALLKVEGEGTFLINCKTYPDHPYKGIIFLTDQKYPLKAGGKVNFNLQTSSLSPDTLTLSFQGSEKLNTYDAKSKKILPYGYFKYTYKKIK